LGVVKARETNKFDGIDKFMKTESLCQKKKAINIQEIRTQKIWHACTRNISPREVFTFCA
jgi:hypothetical protein